MVVKEIGSVETTAGVEESTLDNIKEVEEQSTAADVVAETTAGDSKAQIYLLSALAKDADSALAELSALVLAVGSKVEKAEDLGVKRLAFPINQHRELSLVSVFFHADALSIKKLESELKHTETIERHLLSTWRAGLEEPKRRPSTGLGVTLNLSRSRPAERQKGEVNV